MNDTIIYNRTSTEEQHPELQVKDCNSINKWGGADYYQDKQSAWKDSIQREKFNEVLDRIKKKTVKRIIVWDLDRIYRNREKLKEFFEICKSYQVEVYSYRQQFLNDMMQIQLPPQFQFIKEMMINNLIEFLGWIAQEESQKKSDRVRSAIRKDEGITKSYKGNKWGRKSIPRMTTEQILKLFKAGKTIRAIAQEVYYWDASNNKRYVSRGVVHKTIQEFKQKNLRNGDGI